MWVDIFMREDDSTFVETYTRTEVSSRRDDHRCAHRELESAKDP